MDMKGNRNMQSVPKSQATF